MSLRASEASVAIPWYTTGLLRRSLRSLLAMTILLALLAALGTMPARNPTPLKDTYRALPYSMIPIKTPAEIRIMREGGRKLAQVMEKLKEAVQPGLTTQELDKLAQELILSLGAKPAFKGYQTPGAKSGQPFPATLCTSINEEIVHCLPSERILREGDILNLDCGILYQGFYTDMAVTVGVGKISPEAHRLIRVTKKALKRAIGRMKPGKHLGDVSQAIQNYVESQGFNVVRDLCGHGIGRQLHQEPDILNFGQRHKGPELKEGMVFALEPMVVMGHWQIKQSSDSFGYQTADNSLSAHFEHTVAVGKKGGRVLTKSP